MPAWLIDVLAIFNMFQADLPQIEVAVAGFWTFMSTEFAKLFGAGTSAATNMNGMVAQAQAEVAIHDADHGAQAMVHVKKTYASLDALLAAKPGLAQAIAVEDAMIDNGLPRKVAVNVVQAALTNVRVADPAYQAQIAALQVAAKKKP